MCMLGKISPFWNLLHHDEKHLPFTIQATARPWAEGHMSTCVCAHRHTRHAIVLRHKSQATVIMEVD